MVIGVSIRINGRLEDINKVSYDIFAIDKRKMGPENYILEMGFSNFEDKLKHLYESNLDGLRECGFFEGELPSFEEMTKNEGLLKKIYIEWFGYAVVAPFLKCETRPDWLVQTVDNVQRIDEKIIISGTISKIY